jgi:hypothetical protein
MASIAKPPCDEGAILGGSCQRPVTAGSPWIVAATILGSRCPHFGTACDSRGRFMGRGTLRSVPRWRCSSSAGLWETCTAAAKIFGCSALLVSVGVVWTRARRQLIAARGLQGIGGALLVPGAWRSSAPIFLTRSAAARSYGSLRHLHEKLRDEQPRRPLLGVPAMSHIGARVDTAGKQGGEQDPEGRVKCLRKKAARFSSACRPDSSQRSSRSTLRQQGAREAGRCIAPKLPVDQCCRRSFRPARRPFSEWTPAD